MAGVIKNFIITDGVEIGAGANVATTITTGTSATVGNSTVNTAVTVSSIRTGNTTAFTTVNSTATNTGILSVRNSANVAGTLGVDGAVVITNTIAHGNTTVAGFVNATSSVNVGGTLSVTGAVNTGSSVAVGGTLAAGNTTITGFINTTSSAQIGGTLTVSGNVTVTGNLTVTGTTTYINTTALNIADNIITLNTDVVGAPTENAGFEINRGSSANSSLRWNETSDIWEVTNDGTTFGRIHSKLADVVLGTDTSGNYVATITNGTGVSVSGSGSETAAVTVSIGQAVATTDNVTFANLSLSNTITVTGRSTFTGNSTFSGAILANNSVGTAGQMLSTSGTGVYWSNSVTSVTAGNGLSGGTIAGTGTIAVIANTGIVANTTGVFVNPTYIATITSNNATNAFGKTEGNLNVNSATYSTYLNTLTSSQFLRSDANTTFSGGTLASQVVTGQTGNIASAANTFQVIQPSTTVGDAFMTFLNTNRYGVHFGLNTATNDLFVGGYSMGAVQYKMWHAGNDGAGSSLDADLLDGQEGAYYAANTLLSNYTLKAGDTLSGRLVQSSNGFGSAVKNDITARIDSGYFETATATTAEGWPETTNNYYHLLACTQTDTGGYYSMQFAGSFYDATSLYYRATNNSGTATWYKVWHSGNDGAGSGLDADLLAGQSSAYYQPASSAITTGNIGSQSVSYATTAGGVAWTNVSGRPTALSSFTNDSAYITTAGRAYGRKVDGNNWDLNWTAQSGQPTYILGSNDGTTFYAYNPTNFSVANAVTAATSTALNTGSGYRVAALGVGTAASGTTGEIRATNEITAYYSDRRLKDIEGVIPNSLDKVNRLSGVYFTSNELAGRFGYRSQDRQVGVIAQEVQSVLPEVVVPAPFDTAYRTTEDGTIEQYSISGEEYQTVHYEKLVPLLIEAIKELSGKVTALEKQLNGN